MLRLRQIASKLPNRYKVGGAHAVATVRRHLGGPRMLPSFLIIGAQKAGTSSMYQYLCRHPDIMKPLRKDVFFFDRNFEKGLSWYSSYFPSIAEQNRLEDRTGRSAVTFEAATYYIFHPLAASRVMKEFPQMKIIAMLRDPVKRAVSHYHHNRHAKIESLSMRDAFRTEWQRLAGEEERILYQPGYDSFNHNHYSYIARGIYERQLRRWSSIFPKEQIFIIAAEDFFASPDQTSNAVCRFLQLPEFSLPRYPVVGASRPKDVQDEDAVQFARAQFDVANEQLFSFLGRSYQWS